MRRNLTKSHLNESITIHLVFHSVPGTQHGNVQPGVILDFDAENRVVGVEILRLRDGVPEAMLRTSRFDTTSRRIRARDAETICRQPTVASRRMEQEPLRRA